MHIGLNEMWILVDCACWRSGLTHYTDISGTEPVECKDCMKAADTRGFEFSRLFTDTAHIGDGTVRHAVRRKE